MRSTTPQAARAARPPAAPSDEALAAAAAGGDRPSFDALVERHAERLFRYLHARLRDRHDAEEVTQESFLRAWSAIARFDRRWRFSTWLYTIARREAVSLLRRRRAGAADALAHEPEHQPEHRNATRRGAGADVWALAARALGRDEYEAIYLRYAEDRTPREVAAILGRSPVAVRVMLHRARNRLRDALANEDTGKDQP